MKAFIIFLFISSIFYSSPKRHHGPKTNPSSKNIPRNYKLCNKQNCPVNRGTCSSENICVCFGGYLTTFEQAVYCDYD